MRLPATRLYLMLLVGIIGPWFVPAVRDKLGAVYQRAGAAVLVSELHNEALPASVAIIRAARSRFQGLTQPGTLTVSVNGEIVEVVEPTQGSTTAQTFETPALEDISLNSGPSLTADEVEAVLVEYNSPAAGKGLGEWSVQESKRTGIDNAYFLAMFQHESSLGTAPGWAGRKGDGHYTANTGNIIAIPGYPAYGRFADFQDDWKLGTTKHFELLRCYRDGGGEGCDGLWSGKKHATIVEVISTWAPVEDSNDPNSYAQWVIAQTKEWRQAKANLAAQAIQMPSVPSSGGRAELWPNAEEGINWDYGFHAGAYDWVAPEGTDVFAPVSGTFVTQGEYWEADKYGAYVILLTDKGLEVYVGHLNHETTNPLGFQPGQRIEAGQPIGELSEFPYSAPHSHVQLRRNGQLVSADDYWTEWNNR